MKKQIKYRPKGLSKAEQDWLKAQERREFIGALIVIVVGVIIITLIIKLAEGVLKP